MKSKEEAGFSLVELIVVIAIMAVLVGVLAPAYLKYVEKSRKSTDISVMDQVFTTANAVATDMEYHVPMDTVFDLTATNGEIQFNIPKWGEETSISDSSDKYWSEALQEWKTETNNGDPYSLHSKEWKSKSGKIEGVVNQDGNLRWSLKNGGGVFADMCNYSAAIASKFEE